MLNLPFDQKSFILCGNEQDRSILQGIEACNGFYEPHIMNLLRSIIEPHSVCLDIGANIGVISLALSHLAKDGKIYSFEPSSSNFPYLLQNISENHIQNVEAINTGVYDHNTNIAFIDFEDGGGWSYIPNGTKTDTPDQVISCVKIDDWVAMKGIDRLDFVKMDIEGSEIQALNGALSSIHQWQPDLIIEFNTYALSELAGQNPLDLFKLLKSTYPHIYLINRSDYTLFRIHEYDQILESIKPLLLGDLYCTFKDVWEKG